MLSIWSFNTRERRDKLPEPLANKQEADRLYKNYALLTSYTILPSVAVDLAVLATAVQDPGTHHELL